MVGVVDVEGMVGLLKRFFFFFFFWGGVLEDVGSCEDGLWMTC